MPRNPRNPRPSAGAAATVAAAAPELENTGNERVAVPMPSGIAWPVMKRYQALFILVAHAEVRSRGDAGKLSVKEQETVILDSYKNHVRLWYRDDADLLNTPNFPQCPAALKRVGGENDVVVTSSTACSAPRKLETTRSLGRLCCERQQA